MGSPTPRTLSSDGLSARQGQLALPRFCALFAAVVSLVVLCGWLLHLKALLTPLPGFPVMAVPTAVGFLLSSAALTLQSPSPRISPARGQAARLLALLVFLLGLVTLLYYVLTNSNGSSAVPPALFPLSAIPINRTSPNTAINFILLGIALLLLETPWAKRKSASAARNTAAEAPEAPRWPYQMVALVVVLDAFLALVGQCYGVTFLYGVSQAIGMALPTAVLFLALGLGVLSVHPERGFVAILLSNNVAGQAARRLLPVVVAVPLVLGAVTLLGFRSAPSFTTYLMVVASIGVLISLFWSNILTLHRQVEQALSYASQVADQAIALERQQGEIARAALILQQRRFVRDMLASVTEGKLCLCGTDDDLPLPLPPVSDAVALTPTTLRLMRKRAEVAAGQLDLSVERTQEIITAVGEAAMNAVKHGGGGIGRVHADTGKGTVQIWIRDQGTGIREEDLHRATLEQGWSSAGSLGHGFYLMLRTVDRTYLLTSAEGTTIVLEQHREVPQPIWLSAFAPQ